MNLTLQEILDTRKTTTPGGGKISVTDGIDRYETEFLQQIVAELNPRVTLEVGLAYGISALAICDAASSSSFKRHIVIDSFQNSHPKFQGIGLHNLNRAGFEQLIEFHETFSHRALPRIEARGEQIDLAFIDGWHTFDFTLVDFFFIDKMLPKGGVVVFDDADWPSVRGVIRYIVTNLPYRVYKCLPSERVQGSFSRRAYDRLVNLASIPLGGLAKLPGLEKPLSRALSADLLGIDRRYGLQGSCIALQKVGEDQRQVNHHVEF